MIAHLSVASRPLLAHMPLQQPRQRKLRFYFWRRIDNVAFPVTSVRDAVARAVVPEVSRRRCHETGLQVWLAARAVPADPGPLGEIGGVGRVAPLMAVFGDFAIAIQVVQRDKAAGQRMRIRGHVAAEKRKRGIAVAYAQIAEY